MAKKNNSFRLFEQARETSNPRVGTLSEQLIRLRQKNIAESLSDDVTVLPQFDQIVFIGLNALNACEKALLDHLKREGRADFCWDFDGAMVTDPDNLAGRFLRENLKRYPPRAPFACPALDP